MRQMTIKIEKWELKRPFIISRMEPMLHGEVIVVEISQNGISGRGECERVDVFEPEYPSVAKQIEEYIDIVEQGVTREDLLRIMPSGHARNAIDCALFDLETKKKEIPAWKLAGLDQAPEAVTTMYTLPLSDSCIMAEMADQNSHRPILKLKLGRGNDIERVTAVRNAAPHSRLIVDANTSWTLDQLLEYLPKLVDLGVELIEQPLPPEQDHLLDGVNSAIPIAADESCLDRTSLANLVGRYQVVNVKLDKTGGITEALALTREAKKLGFDIMVGCMIGTSLAIAPALLLAQMARWIDLDSPLLLTKDRNHGLVYKDSLISPSSPALWG